MPTQVCPGACRPLPTALGLRAALSTPPPGSLAPPPPPPRPHPLPRSSVGRLYLLGSFKADKPGSSVQCRAPPAGQAPDGRTTERHLIRESLGAVTQACRHHHGGMRVQGDRASSEEASVVIGVQPHLGRGWGDISVANELWGEVPARRRGSWGPGWGRRGGRRSPRRTEEPVACRVPSGHSHRPHGCRSWGGGPGRAPSQQSPGGAPCPARAQAPAVCPCGPRFTQSQCDLCGQGTAPWALAGPSQGVLRDPCRQRVPVGVAAPHTSAARGAGPQVSGPDASLQ